MFLSQFPKDNLIIFLTLSGIFSLPSSSSSPYKNIVQLFTFSYGFARRKLTVIRRRVYEFCRERDKTDMYSYRTNPESEILAALKQTQNTVDN
jgi:hypothetical protein